jgi:ribosomal protein L7/L12
VPLQQELEIPASQEIVWTTHRLTQEQIKKVDSIFHKILWLDTMETALLTASINFKLGRTITPKQNAAIERQLEMLASGNTGGSRAEESAPVEEAPALFSVQLSGFDDKAKIKVIKEVRAISGLGLKEAKEFVESAPTILQKDLSADKAEELKARLEAVGAKIDLV